MAVTITAQELSDRLRVGSTPEELAEVTYLLDYASVAVLKYASGAPDVVQDEAVRLLAGYLFDAPTQSGGDRFANAMRNSGAARTLLPYRVHRAGSVDDALAAAQAAIGTVGNPVTGLAIAADDLIVTFADGTTEHLPLPAGGGAGEDAVARTAAATALTAANTADQAADAAQADANANTAALALKVERSDVSAGIGIALTETVGDARAFTISATGSAGGPSDLSGAWAYQANFSSAQTGEVVYSGNVGLGEIDTWLFGVDGRDGASTDLQSLRSGDEIEIEESATRHQLVTLTETPTLTGTTITVTGRTNRGISIQIPRNNAAVAITLIPGPIQGVDQTARDAAGEAQADADAADIAADAAQADITAHQTNHPSGGSIDQSARDAAATAQAAADAAQTDADAAQTTADGKDDAWAWATEGNTESIPLNKLGNAPVSGDGGTPVTSTTVELTYEQKGPVGISTDVDIANSDRFYDTAIDMPATTDILDADVFVVSPQNRDGTPVLETVFVSGKDWKLLEALTVTEQAQTAFSAGSAGKVITFFLRNTTADGRQEQHNFYLAKGNDEVSLYVGDNHNSFDANITVWNITAKEQTVVSDVSGGGEGGGGGGGGTAVLLGSATAVGTPIFITLPAATATAFYTAYNAETYPGGYRFDLKWTIGTLAHGASAVMPANMFSSMVDGSNYQFHLDASAALDTTISRYVVFNRATNPDKIEIVTLPSGHDFDVGTVIEIWGLP